MPTFPAILSEIAIVCGLALLIGAGREDLGLMSGVFAVAAFRLLPAIRSILNNWGTLQNASYTLEIVAEGIADIPQKEMETESPFTFRQGIELCGVSFAFPDGHILLET